MTKDDWDDSNDYGVLELLGMTRDDKGCLGMTGIT